MKQYLGGFAIATQTRVVMKTHYQQGRFKRFSAGRASADVTA
jgi:hypothetical protein